MKYFENIGEGLGHIIDDNPMDAFKSFGRAADELFFNSSQQDDSPSGQLDYDDSDYDDFDDFDDDDFDDDDD